MDITKNEMLFILSIFKSPEVDYNANNIAKKLGLTSMGALKIARRLEKEEIILSKELGKARFYKINFDNDYAIQYIKFLLKREAEQSNPYLKMWISDVKKIKYADAAMLYGSVLRKYKEANDIDVLLVTDKKRFPKLEKEIESINNINVKKIHPMYQTKEDIKENIKKRDKPLLNAIKGIAVFGEDFIIKLLK